MHPQQVKEYYGGSITKASVALGVNRGTIHNWLKWGFVPRDPQFRICGLTGGALPVDPHLLQSNTPESKEN